MNARDGAVRWLAAGLCVSRVIPPSDERLERAAPWIVAAIGERLGLPPAGVVLDLGALLHGQALTSRMAPAGDDRLDAVLLRYEDAILGRLGTDPALAACVFAVTRLPEELRVEAVGMFVARFLDHVRFPRGVALPPGLVRASVVRPAISVVERGFSALRDDATVRTSLAEGYEALVRGARDTTALVSAADVFALENLAVLRSHTQRLAIAQIVDAEEALASSLPRRIRRTRKSTGDAPTRMEDESAYPVGGFASIATAGSLENLVTSELIYMDPPPPAGAPRSRSVDLFDLRYAEGELLYYTRDEAIFRRRRRVVSFILHGDLVATRVKDPAVPWQRVVLLCGLLVATIKRLFEELGDEAIRFRVVFARESAGHPSPLAGERELCELALREWREKGVLEVEEATIGGEAVALAEASRSAHVFAALFVAEEGGHMLDAWNEAARAAKLDAPVLLHTRGLGEALDLEGWVDACTTLIASLL